MDARPLPAILPAAPIFGTKKLKANCLLESGIKARWAGCSKESNKVPVLYCENCCAFAVKTSKNNSRDSTNLMAQIKKNFALTGLVSAVLEGCFFVAGFCPVKEASAGASTRLF